MDRKQRRPRCPSPGGKIKIINTAFYFKKTTGYRKAVCQSNSTYIVRAGKSSIEFLYSQKFQLKKKYLFPGDPAIKSTGSNLKKMNGIVKLLLVQQTSINVG